MKMRRVLVCAVLLSAFPAFATGGQAKRKSLHDELTGQDYGTAGCGLGSVLLGNKPGIIQIFAVTSNDFMGNQTFGMTSGTLNCEDRKQPKMALREKMDHYVAGNHNQLKNDIAKASGESLSALESLANCSQRGELGKVLQGQYSTIYSDDADSKQVSQRVYDIVSTSKLCGV